MFDTDGIHPKPRSFRWMIERDVPIHLKMTTSALFPVPGFL